MGATLGILLLLIGLFLLFLLGATIWDFFQAALRLGPYAEDATGEAIRNTGLVLVAFFGAPFLVWRTWVAARQADLQFEALFNDKINAAATGLSARQEVTRLVEESGTHRVLSEWQDDLVTRATAIDRLEGLAIEAIERGDFAPAQRIAKLLSVYVQELSREHPARENPADIWARLTKGADHSPALQPSDISKDYGILPDQITPKGQRAWSGSLAGLKRSDLERAVQSLGRINPRNDRARSEFNPANIVLRGCNLQGLDLSELNLQGALLTNAKLQGSNLYKTFLNATDLSGANFLGANLDSAFLNDAVLDWANFQWARMMGAQLVQAQMLMIAMQGAMLRGANLQGARVGKVDLRSTDLGRAHLEGATLKQVDLRGAFLDETLFSEKTDFQPENMGGAATRKLQPVAATELAVYSTAIFQDDSLKSNPNQVTESPFHLAWRSWAKREHPEVIIAGD
ncbi:hypothetical protein roselon_00250 [Roseibacterium elongatum DSM 19469]|uniref:Pentapeptide repeat family protein n=1 Tax=Roseicyclus elongatus DSM 19469 TaxID=1294273 RepID=W8SJL7_9RHOB|nr:hypothetical protein roselon_00250 [Roseibacterium elongatum DSM 19469]